VVEIIAPALAILMKVTVRLMLSDRCPVLSVLSFCNVGVLWPNGWMDQDATWYGGRPRPTPHCVRWGPNSLHGKGHSSPQLSRCTEASLSASVTGPCLLWPNG